MTTLNLDSRFLGVSIDKVELNPYLRLLRNMFLLIDELTLDEIRQVKIRLQNRELELLSIGERSFETKNASNDRV